jgi:hypothetical protein
MHERKLRNPDPAGWGDVERVIAVSRCFVFACFNDLDAVLTHQAANPTVPNIHPQFLQLFGHAWPAIAL